MQTLHYAGVDVHKECIVVVVLDERGKVVMGSVIETKAQTARDFFQGVRGTVHVTLMRVPTLPG